MVNSRHKVKIGLGLPMASGGGAFGWGGTVGDPLGLKAPKAKMVGKGVIGFVGLFLRILS